MKAYVTSLRDARFTTMPPRQAIRNAKNATDPHCAGDTHTWLAKSNSVTMPPFVGLNRCLPRTLIRNFDAIATTAAATARLV
jgi:hypothetical protein